MEREAAPALTTCPGAAGLLVCVFALHLPFATIAEGVLWIPEGAMVRAETDGEIWRIAVKDDHEVGPGDALMVLDNVELAAHLNVLEAFACRPECGVKSVLRSPRRVSGSCTRQLKATLKAAASAPTSGFVR
jgi:hypothetical protein